MNVPWESLSHVARRAFIIGAGVWVIAVILSGRLPDAEDMKPQLQVQPVQTDLRQSAFSFPYEHQEVRVTPIATYEISGLVVSHNDPSKWYRFDITHDDQSLNTRDICLVWGSNVQGNGFKHISFHNDDWACLWSYGAKAGRVNDEEISNNHLITANDDIRDQIDALMVGDQVRISGKLVSYSEERWGTRTRMSSLNRSDKGNGACEIILVERLEVLDSHNYWLGVLRSMGAWMMYGATVMLVAVFLRPRKKRKRRRHLVGGRWDGSQ